MSEIFKSIIGFPNYAVSNNGHVKNIKTNKLRKPVIESNGYASIQLLHDGKRTKHYVHKLVAGSFLPHPKNKSFVDHIDRNRSNDNVNNLRWVNRSENNMNRTTFENNTSGVAGLNKLPNNDWRVQIFKNGIRHELGTFENKDDAIDARKKGEQKYFKEYNPEKITVK